MAFIKRHHLWFFLLGWLLINLIQAGTTELFDDEAYYWIYAKYPAWGYFDHPPMIAWLIKAGYGLFPNEFGLRLFIVVLNTATLFLIRNLMVKKDDRLFYAIAASIAIAQIGGIIAVPDLPLLFFAALFFVVYKYFMERMTVPHILLLGLSMALMLYSKYHGILIILFTFLAHPRIIRYYQAWLAVLFGILLFLPHLYWQYSHGFPSVMFHLFERNAVNYRISFTSEYLLGQLAIAGPLLGWLFIWAALRVKPATLTERAMKFSLIGIYAVFFLSTLKGRVEANWTVCAFVGLIVLSHQYLLNRPALKRWVYIGMPITLALVFVVRIYMLLNVPPASFISKDEFHGNRTRAAEIQKKAGNLPVVFIDSYQKPSKYMFYGAGPAFSLNTPWYRRNNYNYWPIEDSLLGKPVYVVGANSPLFTDSLLAPGLETQKGVRINRYFSFSKIAIGQIKTGQAQKGLVSLECLMESPRHYLHFFAQPVYDTCSVILTVYDGRGDVSAFLPGNFKLKEITGSSQRVSLNIPHQLSSGTYSARLGISSCLPGFPSLNSSSFRLIVP